MSQLIRLVYASQSNTSSGSGAVDPVVGSILSQSRRNNTRDQIGGLLYYGDGFFFQCLEGEKEVVEATYARIQGDVRHSHARIIRLQGVEERMFRDWSMKYVPAQSDIKNFLRSKGVSVFNPFRFQEDLIDELLLFFRDSREGANLEVIGTTENLQNQPDKSESVGLLGKIGRALGFSHSA